MIGTLRTQEINAQARTGPADSGHLVVFDDGLFTFAAATSSTAAQLMDARTVDDGSALQFLREKRIRERISTHPGVVVQFADTAFSHVVLGSCAFATRYPPPTPNAPVADRLADAVLTFALAHEYGHVILRHVDLDQPPSAGPAERHAEELAADRVGADICRTALKGSHWAIAGACLFLSGVLALDGLAVLFQTGRLTIPPSESHPPADARIANLLDWLANAPGVPAEYARQLGRAIAYAIYQLAAEVAPAFERAQRAGYPPAGFRPATELEQHAALMSFIAPLGLGALEPTTRIRPPGANR